MSDWRLVRLNFGRNPTHFGETGIGLEKTSERVRSDTLFSAWVSAYARTYGKAEVKHLLEKFVNGPEPPFRVSSTFVYRWLEQNFIDYLPKLIEQPIGYPDDDLSFAKPYRKLTYLPKSVWRRWYQGDGFTSQDAQDLETYAMTPDDTSSSLAQAGCFSYKEAFTGYELPKVAIDRTTRATNFYHTGLIQFAWQPASNNSKSWDNQGVESLAGLYFLLKFPHGSTELEDNLKQSLAILGEEGIGGERSSGAGRFTILSWENLPKDWRKIVDFEKDDKRDRHSLISLFWEQQLDPAWLGKDARYAVQERGGWIASPFSGRQLRRQMIRMFSEGSVFPNKPNGQLADVTPPEFITSDGRRVPHAIYRNGIALSLPIRLGKDVA